MDDAQWSMQEFGDTRLGDQRRTKRLVAMGARVAASPAGRITEVFTDVAEREGAFRFVENDEVHAAELTRAAARAAARRVASEGFVFAPTDGTSLNLPDGTGRRGMGRIGRLSRSAQGLQVMTVIGVNPDGTPVGILGQRYWARDRTGARKKDTRKKRSVDNKETKEWLAVMAQAREAQRAEAPRTRLWFQLDRAGDAWPILRTVVEDDCWITVRAAWDRRVVTSDPQQRYLWETMEMAALRGAHRIDVPASSDGKRTARTAQLVVRAAEVTIDLLALPNKDHLPTRIWAVWVLESGTTPEGEEPIEWMLLSNHSVLDFDEALLVIRGYAQRWRIEQFHRTWKSGACNVESTQLADRDHIVTWVTLLASVAMRIVRLTYFARQRPDDPAQVELTRNEVDAAILVSKTKSFRRGDELTIADAVALIARCGGYVGRSSGGPPGALVIARGLARIQPVADVLEEL